MSGSTSTWTAATGVAFPAARGGGGASAASGRSKDQGGGGTSDFARAVLSTALAGVDTGTQHAVLDESAWRSGYLRHFRTLTELSLRSPQDAVRIAGQGLEAVAEQMRWIDVGSGAQRPLSQLTPSRGSYRVMEVGGGTVPLGEFRLPHRGRLLGENDLDRQLTDWVTRGVLEPSAAQAVRTVANHPEWLSLPGMTLVALGAGSEIGPAPTLLRWGARVAAIDLPRPELWQRVIRQAESAAGTMVIPVVPGAAPAVERAGLDLLTELDVAAAWVDSLPGALVLGNYLYADGGTHVRLSAAADAMLQMVRGRRHDVTPAFLATPTDVFAVPGADVDHANSEWYKREGRLRVRSMRAVSAGRLLRRAYPPGADPGICDSLVAQQGPNYALAKRLQRWRADVEHAAGHQVSLNVAPPTRTRSVVRNRALSAAYAGAHRFGVEVFSPSTTRVLMAALLVHDLYAEPRTFAAPWQAEAHAAVHGGLWTAPYEPRSALGLSALLGIGGGRQ